MSRIHSRDTKPEVRVRRALFAAGYRFRINVKGLPGTPDIVLPKYHTAIFVNGCFWHGHRGCKYYTVPESNTQFWVDKVTRNRERDEIVTALLEAHGWSVVTIWECELKPPVFDTTITRLQTLLHKNLDDWNAHRALRLSDRAFALDENRRRRAVRASLEAELRSKFDIPSSIVRLSHTECD